jgi:DNA-binding response OmpR family regulator
MIDRQILIVEDDDSIRELLADLMDFEGFSYLTAIDGRHAIEILESGQYNPTLILLDLNMPRLSGKEFLIEREKLGLVPNANVLMLSATSEIESFPEISAWIRKPVDLNDLLSAIDKYDRGRGKS